MTNLNTCLVLNKHWTAITVTSVFRSITLMCRGSALSIDPVSYEQFDLDSWIEKSNNTADTIPDNKKIKITTGIIEKPEIILLTIYGGIPYVEISFNRRNVYRRDNYQCQYCSGNFNYSKLSLDHVVPRSKNGATNWENCVTSCMPCNRKKSDKLLMNTSMRLKKKPITPKWNPILSCMPSTELRPSSWGNFVKT